MIFLTFSCIVWDFVIVGVPFGFHEFDLKSILTVGFPVEMVRLVRRNPEQQVCFPTLICVEAVSESPPPTVQNTGGIWKRSLISTVISTVRTNPSRKQSICKRSSNRGNLQPPAFRKRWRHNDHMIAMTVFSANTSPKWPVVVAFLNSSELVWTQNSWCVFRVKYLFTNFSVLVWAEPWACLEVYLEPARGNEKE